MTMTEIRLSSSAFKPGSVVPTRYTADGQDISPPLEWGDVPSETQTLALVCEDPDAPRGLFTHWLVFNLPAQQRGLAEGASGESSLPEGAVQGTNGFGKIGYNGPSPPPGAPHRYVFRLFALDTRLEMPPSVTHDALICAMANHVIARGELLGLYGRQPVGASAFEPVEQHSSSPPEY